MSDPTAPVKNIAQLAQELGVSQAAHAGVTLDMYYWGVFRDSPSNRGKPRSKASLREYDKKDGSKGASLEVRVNDLTLLGKRDTDTQYSAPAAPPRQAAPARPQQSGGAQGGFGDFDDDIPFAQHAAGAAWRAV